MYRLLCCSSSYELVIHRRRRGVRFCSQRTVYPPHPSTPIVQNGVLTENLDGYCYYLDNKTVAQHDISVMAYNMGRYLPCVWYTPRSYIILLLYTTSIIIYLGVPARPNKSDHL